MLRFTDFDLPPEVDDILLALRHHQHGLLLVAGPDARPVPGAAAGPPAQHFLPSGRQTIFRILVSELLDAQPDRRAVVISHDRDVLHVARRFKRRLTAVNLSSRLTYAQALAEHSGAEQLLVIDHLTPDNVDALLALAADGQPVIAQLDTVYHGARVAQQLLSMGASPESLAGLGWVVTIQRLPRLCAACRRPATLSAEQRDRLAALDARYRPLAAPGPVDGAFDAAGCPACEATGRQGDVAVIDLFEATAPMPDLLRAASRLSLESGVWLMARRGHLAISDSLDFGQEQLRRVYNLLAGSEERAAQANRDLERKAAELETANHVLEQRTRELVALESLSQTLLATVDLAELGGRLIFSAMQLCKADRAVLYVARSATWVQVLAARGWPGITVGTGLLRAAIDLDMSAGEKREYLAQPPGLDAPADLAPARCGLAIPLVADGHPNGLLIIQSTRKGEFAPGEQALLEALAGHAAMALQRAGLIEQLQAKVAALEAAQVELAQKERLDRELELARDLQLSMVPQTFPDVPGFSFGARYAPARQVGGDFYDVLPLSDGRLGLVIADVADKGMAAALTMTVVRALMLATAGQVSSPAAVLRRLNRELIRTTPQDTFVTVFYAVLDPLTRRLTYACAGHDRPWLVRDGALQTLDGRGIVLGLFEAAGNSLSEHTVALRSGDRLVLYTDGLCDLTDRQGRMLGKERLGEWVVRHAPCHAAGFCEALFDDLAAFQGTAPQFDDMALLTVCVI